MGKINVYNKIMIKTRKKLEIIKIKEMFT